MDVYVYNANIKLMPEIIMKREKKLNV